MNYGCLLAFMLAGAIVSAAQPRQADYVLDVLGYRHTREPEREAPSDTRVIQGGSVSATSGGPVAPGLSVRLLSLDSLSYETGDPVIYELWIENIGKSPVALPWSPDRVLFTPPTLKLSAPNVVQGSVALEVRARGNASRLAVLEPQPLFGSDDVLPGSLARLAPGQTAWIRTSGFWRMTDSERELMLRQPNGIVEVGAVLNIFSSLVRVQSQNTIEVSIQDRLRRFR